MTVKNKLVASTGMVRMDFTSALWFECPLRLELVNVLPGLFHFS
jgi:hypothetical protein